jgi:uncharacterized protein YjbJ (UPF0337 family)
VRALLSREQNDGRHDSILIVRRFENEAPFTDEREFTMNKDQVKGKAKDIGGKIQEEAGKLVGSSEQQAKGLSKQVEGKAQEKVGDVKDAINKGNR